MKHAILFILSMVMATVAFAKPEPIVNPVTSQFYVELKFAAGDTEDSDLIPGAGTCAISFIQSGSDTVSLYQVPDNSTPTSSGTLVTTFSATTTNPRIINPGQGGFKAKGVVTTTGGSRLIFRCSNSNVSNGFHQIYQLDPNVEEENLFARGFALTPPGIEMGFGIDFSRAQYSGTPGNDPTHHIGWYYNIDLTGSNFIDQFEHGCNNRYETAWRDTSATANQTFFEYNWNCNPPDNKNVVTPGAGFSPLVNEMVDFSGGGTGRVLSWDSGTNTLEWRQDYGGIDKTANETVTSYEHTNTLASVGSFNPTVGTVITFSGTDPNASGVVVSWSSPTLVWRSASVEEPGGGDTVKENLSDGGSTGTLGATITTTSTTATLGNTFVFTGSDVGHFVRPFAQTWSVLNNDFDWAFKTGPAPTSGPDDSRTLRIAAKAVGANYLGSLSAPGLWVGSHNDNFPAATFVHETAGFDGLSSHETKVVSFATDWSATNSTFFGGNRIEFPPPIAPGSGSTVTGRQRLMEVKDQGGYGTAGSILYIATQGCSGGCLAGAGAYGNIVFEAGNWDTGHLAFGGENSVGDHIWMDQTNEVLRKTTDATPSSEAGGVPFVTGTGAATHGPAQWAISDAASFDTGDEVCQAQGVGMTCQDVIEFSTVGTPTDSTCTTAHASAVKFIAFCK